jgi:hypothetical protein
MSKKIGFTQSHLEDAASLHSREVKDWPWFQGEAIETVRRDFVDVIQSVRSRARIVGRMPIGIHRSELSGGRVVACLAALSARSYPMKMVGDLASRIAVAATGLSLWK